MAELTQFLTHPAILGMLLLASCMVAVDWYVLWRFDNVD